MTTRTTPYRAFGYIVIKTTYDDGDHVVTPHPEGRVWTNYITEGTMINAHTDAASTPANESLPDSTTGQWWTPAELQEFYGTLIFDAQGATTCWCLCAEANNNWMPYVDKWLVTSGETVTLPVGTKLFFCKGSITINGTTYTDTIQIHAKTSEISVTTNEDSYGILFL